MRTPVNPVPFASYNGGKSGNGTYQQIINEIPPHRVFMSLFAGNCGIFRFKRRAEWSVLNDLDKSVMEKWLSTGINLAGDVRLYQINAVDFLEKEIYTPEYSRLLNHTFIYLDPPYLLESRKSQVPLYKCNMHFEEEHLRLLEAVTALPKGVKVMISHYPNDVYDSLLKDWHVLDYMSTTQKGLAHERLYMNYALDGTLHDYSYIGQNFRERERYKRIKVNFFAKLDKMEPLLRNAMLQEYDLQYRNKVR